MKLLLLVLAFCCAPALRAQDAAPDPAPTGDAALRALLDLNEITYEIDEGGDFKLLYDMGEDRSQLVFLASDVYDYRGVPIREIVGYAYRSDLPDGSFPAEVANTLLAYNATTKIGAWEKRENYAVFVVKLRPDAPWDELNDAYELVLRVADDMERELLGDDDEF